VNLLALYQSHKRALVRITVQTKSGELTTGTAFHIGEGWLVTAANVPKSGVIQDVVPECYGNGHSDIARLLHEPAM
jgi:hypothetical protein